MRPIRDIHSGMSIDYTHKLIEKVDVCIQFLERAKERARDDCPYEVEYNADVAKHTLREICEIAKKVCDYYEITGDNRPKPKGESK